MKMNWWTRLLDFISPRECVVCDRRLTASERSLCTVCLLHVPRTNYHLDAYNNPMNRLFWGLAEVERATAYFHYEPHSELARLIYALKYRQRPDIGEDMGRLMAHELMTSGFFEGIDVLLPVPLSRKRLRQRGYNQSEMLARGISEVTHLPVVTNALRREYFRQSQTALGRRERQENVEGVFVQKRAARLVGQHVLLVDDVCTTGATLLACIKALRDVDNIRISVVTLGLTKKSGK